MNIDRLNRDKLDGHAIFPCGRKYSIESLQLSNRAGRPVLHRRTSVGGEQEVHVHGGKAA